MQAAPNSIATESLLRPRPTLMLPFVAISLAGHVAFVAVALLLSWAMAGPRINLEQTPIKATLVRLGKKRDEKLLPRKKNRRPKRRSSPNQSRSPKSSPRRRQSSKYPAKTRRLKTQQRESGRAAQKSLFDALNKTARAGKAEPLEGDENGDANGDSAKQEGERYYGLVSSVVKRYYDVSDTIDEAERRTLHATVSVRIGPAGELLDVHLSKPSPNETFNSAVIGAVKKAAPFGPPPATLRDSLKKQGVALSFSAI